MAPGGLGVVFVEGWVVDVANPSETGGRLLIAPVRISRLAPSATPTLIRIVVPAPGGPESLPPPGSAIRVETLLDPPPPPAAPGAYDFARDAWFEGIGGVGLAMKPPEPTLLPDRALAAAAGDGGQRRPLARGRAAGAGHRRGDGSRRRRRARASRSR